ncbi:MAG: hypothetical protein QOG03_2630 [Actinomycetota bacterium]|nr:hypothetical protein [Actinomycetota bacterium]
MSDLDLVAVTGATGAVGGRVARRLANEGRAVRLIVRDRLKAPDLDAEIAVASYDDVDAMRAALAGVSSLLFVSGREAEDRLAHHLTVVQAAADAGVDHVVYTSFLGASPQCTFTLGRQHFATEQAIRSHNLTSTFLRDSLYLDFLPFFAGDGEIRAPGGDGAFAPVARDDVARVAFEALLDPALHGGQTYDVTGRDRVTLADAAAILSRLAGREIPYVAETVDEAYASRAKYNAPDWEVAGWVSSYLAIAAGELDAVSDDVERVTGSAPVGIEEWLDANPEAWAHLKA